MSEKTLLLCLALKDQRFSLDIMQSTFSGSASDCNETVLVFSIILDCHGSVHDLIAAHVTDDVIESQRLYHVNV